MQAAVREFVRNRAEDRCEYCRMPQVAIDATFHVDHVIARQHVEQVEDDPEHLALACDRCNFYKGTNLSTVDPESGDIVPLFNPRQDIWEEHFLFAEASLVGLTPIGRATLRLLNMNARNRLELRSWLIEEGIL
ncbi:MAG: HNH endonuclease [Planctomycetota bacterium]|nr:HNH endonuclease [Planctomycetota bacterium]MDP7250252.1 HNH endonuclease [Planctomycetota bacterium]